MKHLITAILLLTIAPTQGIEPFPNPLGFSYTEGQTNAKSEVRDPCIIREGDTYYLVFTMHPFGNRDENRLTFPNQGSSPGIAIYSSKDLKSWTFSNWLVKSSDLPENSPYKHRFWAPEIHKINGKFHIIFTADNWIKPEYNPAGNWGTAGYAFIGVADKITGPYQHITYIKGAACDTSLFADTDGKTYAVIPRGNIDIQEIDLTRLTEDKVELLGKPQLAVSANILLRNTRNAVIRHNKIVNPGTVPTAHPVAAIGLNQVSDTIISDNEVIFGKGNTSKSVYLLGGCDPDTVRIDNNQTSRTP